MQRITLSLFLTILSFSGVFAMFQDDGEAAAADTLWKTDAMLSLNMQQIGFSNWAQGGDATLTYGGVFNLTANRRDKKSAWKNNVRLGYGLQRVNGRGARKNNDLIILNSEYSRKLNKNWQLTAMVDFRTQFTDGYKFEKDINDQDSAVFVSTFFAPAYLVSSLGFTYSPNDAFTATVSPVSSKLTFLFNENLSNQGKYGVDPGSSVRSQVGTVFNVSYNNQIMENVTLKANLLTFTAFRTPELTDVNFDMFIDFKINDWLATNFLVQAIYDHDIKGNHEDPDIEGPALQLRNVWNLGLTFNLISSK